MSMSNGAATGAYKTIQYHEIRFLFAEYELESQLGYKHAQIFSQTSTIMVCSIRYTQALYD